MTSRGVWTAGLGLAMVLASVPAAAREPSVQLACAPAAGPGRVICEVEAEVESGKIRWWDVVVVRAPRQVRPLRARVGGTGGIAASGRRARLALGLVATAPGRGEIHVRARFVVCPARAACRAATVLAGGEVVVGE